MALEVPEVPNLSIRDPSEDGVDLEYLGQVAKKRRMLEARHINGGKILHINKYIN
jgi:hypothetical protein